MELTERNEDVLAHSLFELVLKSDLRRNVLEELRNCLYELDGKIVEKCEAYLKKADADQTSMIYQTSRNYLRDNFSRRPLYVAIKTIDSVLANPNFLRELFIILVVFIQFKDVVKKSVAPNTTEPIFRCYFGNPAFFNLETILLNLVFTGGYNFALYDFISRYLNGRGISINLKLAEEYKR